MGSSISGQSRTSLRRALGGFVAAVFVVFFAHQSAKAEPMRDFVVSCSYGVLAGTLVGAATLAFSDKPGENLNRVARGASLGLYAGMLLGAYVVFGVPAEEDDSSSQLNHSVGIEKRETPRFAVYPLISERGFEGAGGHLIVMKF